MLISVLMSVYNSEEHLEDAITSILNQTYTDFEFIIIDDGSSDNSIDIIQRWAARDKRIIFISNGSNLGLAVSLNKGISIARGKYIARQDADDLSAATRLQKQITFALDNDKVDLIGTDTFVIDMYGQTAYKRFYENKASDFKEMILNRKGIIAHGSAFIKKSKLLELDCYDPRFYYLQDGELWLRFLASGSHIHIVNQPLYYFRLSPVASTKRGAAKIMFNNILRLKHNGIEIGDMVDRELTKVQKFIKSSLPTSRPYHMATYWKNLANASYLNDAPISVSFKYLRRAFQEKNSLLNYPKFFFLGAIYLFPPLVARKILFNSFRG